MANYSDPFLPLFRRERLKPVPQWTADYTDILATIACAYAPGQHGQARRASRELLLAASRKHKGQRIYCLAERQFRGYYHKSIRMKAVAGENLLRSLDRPPRTSIYRLGFASDHS